MFCRFCGTENQAEDLYCKQCGKPLEQPSVANERLTTQTPAEDINDHEEPFCPKCGAGLSNCSPVSKTDVKTSGGGYGFWSGCCGMILLAPFGLLCGTCGRGVKTKVSNEIWFICKHCGAEFMSVQSAIEKACIEMRSVALYTFLLSLAVTTDWNVEGAVWIRLICSAIIIILWAGVLVTMTESTCTPLKKILSLKENATFGIKYILYALVSLVIGLYLGTRL